MRVWGQGLDHTTQFMLKVNLCLSWCFQFLSCDTVKAWCFSFSHNFDRSGYFLSQNRWLFLHAWHLWYGFSHFIIFFFFFFFGFVVVVIVTFLSFLSNGFLHHFFRYNRICPSLFFTVWILTVLIRVIFLIVEYNVFDLLVSRAFSTSEHCSLNHITFHPLHFL